MFDLEHSKSIIEMDEKARDAFILASAARRVLDEGRSG
jgi:hypothetical protein